jgi:hypothetical protein
MREFDPFGVELLRLKPTRERCPRLLEFNAFGVGVREAAEGKT